jgi:hypothetical protein
MRLAPLVLLSLCGLTMSGTSLHAQQPTTAPTLDVYVDAPDAPGTKVTIRYVYGPDSLRGKVREMVAPAEFSLSTGAITLLAERSDRQGHVRLRIERRGKRLTGEGTGDRVRIEVTGEEIHVRAFPRTAPI